MSPLNSPVQVRWPQSLRVTLLSGRHQAALQGIVPKHVSKLLRYGWDGECRAESRQPQVGLYSFWGLWCWLSIVFFPCVNGSAFLDMYIDTYDSFPVILIYFDLLMLYS